jgi:hypothetical protein
MQAIKETVTAGLGFALILFTLWMTYRAFSMVGQAEQMKDALGVLSLLFGLAGVVVGYYFGRMPADARAMQAQKSTERAVGEQVKTQGVLNKVMDTSRGMRDKMHETMAEQGISPSALRTSASEDLA